MNQFVTFWFSYLSPKGGILLDNPSTHQEIKCCSCCNFAMTLRESSTLFLIYLFGAFQGKWWLCSIKYFTSDKAAWERFCDRGWEGWSDCEQKDGVGDCWWWTSGELWVNNTSQSWLIPFTTYMCCNHIMDDFAWNIVFLKGHFTFKQDLILKAIIIGFHLCKQWLFFNARPHPSWAPDWVLHIWPAFKKLSTKVMHIVVFQPIKWTHSCMRSKNFTVFRYSLIIIRCVLFSVVAS